MTNNILVYFGNLIGLCRDKMLDSCGGMEGIHD